MAVTATVPILPCAAVNPNPQGHITPSSAAGRERSEWPVRWSAWLGHMFKLNSWQAHKESTRLGTA